MAFIRQHINYFFILILPVYLYIVQNTIQNKHTHVYANGVVVTHSHPFNKEEGVPINQHEHSKREICLYSSLFIDLYDFVQAEELKLVVQETYQEYLLIDDQVERSFSYCSSIPRAPRV